MVAVLIKGFMTVLMIIFLNAASSDKVSSSLIHSWSDEPWTWGDFFEEQYYETLKFFEDFEFEQNSLEHIRKKRYVNNVGGTRNSVELLVEGVESDNLNYEINSPACLFDFSGQKWVLVLDNVFRIHQHEDNRVFVEFSHLMDNLDYIYDVQTLYFNNSTYVLLIYKNQVEILKISAVDENTSIRSGRAQAIGRIGNDNKLSRKYFKQKISKESLEISRARIFSQNGILYLIVLFSHQGAKTYSYLYRWSGSHFDEVEKILTDSPTDVAIVSLKDGFGIILTQNSKNRNSWQLFKMSSEGQQLRRAYSIPTPNGLIMALTYIDQELLALNEDPHSTYLLLISSAGSSEIYTISENGALRATNSKLHFGNVTSAKVFTMDQGILIFISTEHEVSVYQPSDDTLKSILTTSIGRDKKIQAIDLMTLDENLIGVNIIAKDKRNVDHILIKMRVTENILVAESETSYMEKCFADIEYLLNEKHSEIEDLKRQMESLRKIEDTVTVSTTVNIEDSKIREIHFPETPSLNTTTENLIALAEETRKSLAAMEDLAGYLLVEDELVKINNSMIINGDLIVDNLVAANIEAETVNSLPFEDSQFFIHKDGNRLPEEMVYGRIIRAHRLDAAIFENILQNANILRSLSADNIFTTPERTINGMLLSEVVTNEHSGIIRGAKTFNTLTTENIQIERLGKEFLTPWLMEAIHKETPTNFLHVTKDLTTVDLKVKKINGVIIEEFMNSVLLNGSNVVIKGNLYFKSDLTVKNLKSENFEGKPVDKFFTKTTPQTISSQMAIKSVLVTDLKADRINGVDFSNNVAVTGRHNVVKAPTTIFNLDVNQDLILNCGSAEESLCNIIATKPEDLLQIYNGPVTILGSLTVNDLMFGNDAKAFINDEEFSTEVEQIFWVKNKNQVIQKDLTFSQGLTTPQLQVQMINSQPVHNNLLSFDNLTNVEYVIFHNVTVRNDLSSSGFGDCFRVNYLNQTVVKRFGRYFIKGRKSFSNKLITKSLTTDFINEKNMLAAISGEFQNARFTGEVHFERVKVAGNLQVYTDIGVDVINGFKWTDFIKDSGRINQPTYINSAVFKGLLQANQIVTPNMPLFGIISEPPNYTELDVNVEGSAEINSVYGNQFINDIDIAAISKIVVRKNQPAIVRGIKTFKKEVVVSKEFEGEILNGLPFRRLMTESLTKGDDQVITGNLTVGDLHADRLQANSLNGIPSQEFINTQDDTVFIHSGLDVDGNLMVQNNLVYTKADGCDPAEPQKLPQRNWNYLNSNYDGQLFKNSMKNNVGFSENTETTKNKPIFFTGELNENGISHLNGLEENEASQA